MLKKVVLGTLLIGLIGVLVAGAIIRTTDKTDNVAEARGLGQGQSEREAGEALGIGQGTQGQGQGQGRYAQASGNRQSAGTVDRLYPNYDDTPEDMTVYEGTVILSPETGGDLVIMTDKGEELTVGTGPSYMQESGFALQTGERVQVLGYWEDNELKAAQLTRLQDGQTLMLRDELGRPAWSGAGSAAIGQQNAEVYVARGGSAWTRGSGYNGEGYPEAAGDGAGTGLAEVDEWLELPGTVASVDASLMAVQMDNGELVEMIGRPWTFAQEQGFTASVGDRVTLTGFYEDGEFEVGELENMSTGLLVPIREDSGRPLWAGGGRRGL
ncbi:MAG: hypothetical protein PVH95_08855 [Anaerolineae bacterium]|jgi:hypothetical protein